MPHRCFIIHDQNLRCHRVSSSLRNEPPLRTAPAVLSPLQRGSYFVDGGFSPRRPRPPHARETTASSLLARPRSLPPTIRRPHRHRQCEIEDAPAVRRLPAADPHLPA